MTTSTIGFIARARPTPDCRLPEVPDVVLAASVAPGVTTSTDVIVVCDTDMLVIHAILLQVVGLE